MLCERLKKLFIEFYPFFTVANMLFMICYIETIHP